MPRGANVPPCTCGCPSLSSPSPMHPRVGREEHRWGGGGGRLGRKDTAGWGAAGWERGAPVAGNTASRPPPSPGLETLSQAPPPRLIKTHLPVELLPSSFWRQGCKVRGCGVKMGRT